MEQFCQSKGKYSTYRGDNRGDADVFTKKTDLQFDQVFGVHLHSARTAVESRGSPGYPAVAINLNVDLQRHFKDSIVTANRKYSITSYIFSFSLIYFLQILT